MPASTFDPVNAAIRSSLTKSTSDTNLDIQLAGATKKALLADIEFETAGSYQTTVLDKLKSKYIVLKSTQTIREPEKMGADETLTLAKHELFPIDDVKLGWGNTDWTVGAGMVNMGNTCYLNSILQALFHVPALVNWLISDKKHTTECGEPAGGICIICAMRKTLQDSQQRNTNSIRPYLIYNKLRVVCRNLIPGRQEDAHEFLRYLVEAMEKAYLSRFKNHSEFDSRTKETTPLNQILGGYLRSTVRCLHCGHVSTTFQHFQDLLLDIRKAQNIEEALDGYFSREKLDDEAYHCESCQKKVPATKQFSLERAPMVLCIQLKRFSITNAKIAKHINFRQRLELTKFARHRQTGPLVYRCVALVTHMGATAGCGHYTAIAQAPCGNYYQFDDSMVRQISHQAVFSTNAYIILYELECPPLTSKSQVNGSTKVKAASSTINSSSSSALNHDSVKTITVTSKVQINGNTSSKPYGPELPPAAKVEKINGTATSTVNGNSSHSSPCLTLELSSDSESEQTSEQTSAIKGHQLCDNSKSKSPKKLTANNGSSAGVKTAESTAISSTSRSITRLVPYDDDGESTCSEDTQDNRVSTNASVRNWKVTSSMTGLSCEGNSFSEKANDRSTISELLKMSHEGYSAPVNSWNGTRSGLEKEIKNKFYERKEEERKRALSDNADQGRVKHFKNSNGDKSNPGYNRIQEFHNAKNSGWSHSNGMHRQLYNTSYKHRNRRNFHHKNNFHKKHRFRQ